MLHSMIRAGRARGLFAMAVAAAGSLAAFAAMGSAFAPRSALDAAPWTASDSRIKTNVRLISGQDTIGVINALRPVLFQYSRGHIERHPEIDNHDRYGFLAQEYAGVFPRYVRDSGERLPDGRMLKEIDLQPALVMCVAAIQELHDIAEDHERRIDSLEQLVEKLRQDVDGLRDDVDDQLITDEEMLETLESLAKRVKSVEESVASKPGGSG